MKPSHRYIFLALFSLGLAPEAAFANPTVTITYGDKPPQNARTVNKPLTAEERYEKDGKALMESYNPAPTPEELKEQIKKELKEEAKNGGKPTQPAAASQPATPEATANSNFGKVGGLGKVGGIGNTTTIPPKPIDPNPSIK